MKKSKYKQNFPIYLRMIIKNNQHNLILKCAKVLMDNKIS